MEIKDLSLKQLRKVVSLKEKIEKFEAQIASIIGASPLGPTGKRSFKMSASARARIGAAQRKRWAKLKSVDQSERPKKRRKMSAAGRAKIAAAARARWAKIKAAGKTKL
jgi:hypothetical protein